MPLPSLEELEDEPKKSKFKEVFERLDKRFLIALGAIVIVAAVLLLYVFVPSGKENPPVDPPETTTEAPDPTPTAVPGEEPDSPLAKEGVDFPEVEEASKPVEVNVKDTTISTSQPGTLSLVLHESSSVSPAADKCELQDANTYCLAATTRYGSQSFSYYYTRDIAHSRIFREGDDIRQVDLKGAESAAFVTIPFGDQGDRRVLAIASSDSSGYLVVLPNGSGTETEETLLEGITLN